MCYCGYYAGYITVILPFLAFYLCSAYLLYLVSCNVHKPLRGGNSNRAALCYNNLQARVFIPSTLIYSKYVYQEKHLEEDPYRSGSFY
jgi:hypothetical protein